MRLAEGELGRIKKWLNDNLLTLNFSKTKFLAFSLAATNQIQQQTITLHDCTTNPDQQCNCPSISQDDEITYLGLVIDDRLHWDKNTTHTTKKLRKLIYKFVQLRRFLAPSLLRSIYHALVESTLTYGILAWGGTNNTYIDSLNKTQKLILRIINFKHSRYPSEALFKEYQVLSIRQHYIKKLLIYYRTHTSLNQTPAHAHNTRTRNINLTIPRMKTALAQKHAIYLAPKIHNRLPKRLKLQITKPEFKKQIKTWLMEKGIIHSELLVTSFFH